ATYDDKLKRVTGKLSEIAQDIFSSADKSAIYPVKNKWGKQGWTIIELEMVSRERFVEVLTTALCEVAPEKLGALVRSDKNRLKNLISPSMEISVTVITIHTLLLRRLTEKDAIAFHSLYFQ